MTLTLQGELTMTSDMESLQNAIFLDVVPDSWTKRAYPSMCGLALWFTDLLARIKELEAWSTDFVLPSVVWLAGFFNPQSFLTAIMQAMARRYSWFLRVDWKLMKTIMCDSKSPCVWMTGMSGLWTAWVFNAMSLRRIGRTSVPHHVKEPMYMDCIWRVRAGTHRYELFIDSIKSKTAYFDLQAPTTATTSADEW